jgi:hypothetical protein
LDEIKLLFGYLNFCYPCFEAIIDTDKNDGYVGKISSGIESINAKINAHFCKSQYPLKELAREIEFFFKLTPILWFKFFRFDQSTLVKLSNLIFVYGDFLERIGFYKNAYDAYNFATTIYPDSFYFRLRFAEMTFKNNKIDICRHHISHINHLLFYSGNSAYTVHNTFSNSWEQLDDKIFQQLIAIAAKINFRIG